MKPLPISAIVVFRNERELLEGCLPRLKFCDELILLDMASTDGSREVAQRYTSQIYDWPVEPTADPARVWAATKCRNPWILIVDPDEHYPEILEYELREAMRTHLDAGGFRLPTRFYFKRKYLKGTIWGGDHHSKLVLIHRERGRLLPFCNRIIEVDTAHKTVTLPNSARSHIRHYWSDSYCDLLNKHVRRYPRRDAERLIADGERFSWRSITLAPIHALKQCLVDREGWRDGIRGWLLSGIFAFYHLMIGLWLAVLTIKTPRADISQTQINTESDATTQSDQRKAA